MFEGWSPLPRVPPHISRVCLVATSALDGFQLCSPGLVFK